MSPIASGQIGVVIELGAGASEGSGTQPEVNNFGEATGDDSPERSFLRWRPPYDAASNEFIPLPAAWDSAIPIVIADDGTIAGQFNEQALDDNNLMFTRIGAAVLPPRSSTITALDRGPFAESRTTSFVQGISPDGSIIAGYQRDSGVPGNLAVFRPCLWINGVWEDIGRNDLVFFSNSGISVNNSGDVATTARIQAGPNIRRAYVLRNGAWQDIGDLGGEDAFAFGINEAGLVTGGAENAAGRRMPFVWNPDTGVMTQLLLPPGYISGQGNAINSRGDVVGQANRNGGGRDAIVWPAGSVTGFRLEDRVDDTGWVELSTASDINDCGVVVGNGRKINGFSAPYLVALPPDQLGQSVTTDTDGDAIPDCWETYGLDFDLDGQTDLDLPAMGASPQRQDLFVEVDAMTGRAPAADVLDRVEASFAAAPIENPDGSTGITLHAMLDETNLPLRDYPNAFGDFNVDKAARFGTPAERAAMNAAAVLEARRRVFRYCIFANTYEGTTSSGLGELNGNDFMVTLGGWSTPGGTPDQQAGTFMHELGHTLGLRHGGGDSLNYKPNYLSVMNYIWQVPNETFDDQWRLDYSCFQLGTLNETLLTDVNPLGFSEANPQPSKYDDREIIWGDSTETTGIRREQVGEIIIWNGLPDPADDPIIFYTVDLTQAWDPPSETPRRLDILNGFNDWQNVDLNFRDDPNFADGVNITPDCSLTRELHDRHRSLPDLSSGPQPCAAVDFATPFGELDLADAVAFLDLFAAGDPAADLAAPFDRLEIGDVIAFLNALGAGCP